MAESVSGFATSVLRQPLARALVRVPEEGYQRELLVDLGSDDPFVVQQLEPELLQAACRQRNVRLSLRWQSGYDHSYYFIASFIKDHIRFHSDRLR